VKVQPGWRDNSSMVRQLDWHRQLEQIGGYQDNEAEEEDTADGEDDDENDDEDDAKAPQNLEL